MEVSLAGNAGSVYSSLLTGSCFFSPSIFNAIPSGSAGYSQDSVSKHHPRTQTSVVTEKPRRSTSVSAQEGKGSLTVPTELREPRHRRFLSAPAATPRALRSDRKQEEASASPHSLLAQPPRAAPTATPHSSAAHSLQPLPAQPPASARPSPPPSPQGRPRRHARSGRSRGNAGHLRLSPPSPLSPEITD